MHAEQSVFSLMQIVFHNGCVWKQAGRFECITLFMLLYYVFDQDFIES